MTWWHDPCFLIMIIRLLYMGLNAPKFENMTQRLTHSLMRVKSRDASASKNQTRWNWMVLCEMWERSLIIVSKMYFQIFDWTASLMHALKIDDKVASVRVLRMAFPIILRNLPHIFLRGLQLQRLMIIFYLLSEWWLGREAAFGGGRNL